MLPFGNGHNRAKGKTMNEINADVIRDIISFLTEKEQYGDDWSVEIAELDKILDIILRQ